MVVVLRRVCDETVRCSEMVEAGRRIDREGDGTFI